MQERNESPGMAWTENPFWHRSLKYVFSVDSTVLHSLFPLESLFRHGRVVQSIETRQTKDKIRKTEM
jgi:hypothetical protein